MRLPEKRRKVVSACAAVTGVLLIVAAVIVWIEVPKYVQSRINEAVVVDSPSSSGYDEWVSSYNTEGDETQTYTFFNLTNAEAVAAGAAPIFDPVGPYVYTRNTVKLDVTFPEDGTQAQFKEQTIYNFVPSASVTDDPSKVLLTNFFPFYQAAVNKAGSETALLYGFVPTLLSVVLDEIAGALGMPGNTTAAVTQWANLGENGGANLGSLPQLELAAPPVRNISLTTGAANTLLFGPSGLITDSSAVPTFLGLLRASDISAILTKWPELASPANVLTLAGYFDHIVAVRGLGFAETFFFQGGRGTGLIVTHTLEQWLWQFEDPLLAFLDPSIAGLAHLQFNDTMANMTQATKGWTITATGKNNLKALNQYLQWNGKSSIDAYTPPGSVRGTNGQAFGPQVSSADTLDVFVSEIQRPLNILHAKTTKVKGIRVFEYRLNPSELNPSVQYQSPIHGLFNIAAISHGIPLEISKPYFLNADPALAEAAGLTPDYARDSTFLDVEPMTGRAFRASLKLQINVRINSNLTQVFWPHASSGVWPLLAIHRDGIITDKDASKFKRTVVAVLIAAKVSFGIGLAFGLIAIALALFVFFKPSCGRGVASAGYDDLDSSAKGAELGEGASLLART